MYESCLSVKYLIPTPSVDCVEEFDIHCKTRHPSLASLSTPLEQLELYYTSAVNITRHQRFTAQQT